MIFREYITTTQNGRFWSPSTQVSRNGVYQAKLDYVKALPNRTSKFAKQFDWACEAGDPDLVHTFEEEPGCLSS